jgi:uncharacterized protein YbcI
MRGMDDDRQHAPPGRMASAESLIRSGETEAGESSGSVRARLANAMVGLKKQFYGRGPEAAKAWLLDDYVFVVLEGGLTRNEETLVAAGQASAVRQYRQLFEATMRETTMMAVAELTGRTVLDYHSQIVFDPPRALERFVLGAPDPDHLRRTREAALRQTPARGG